jgi:hypothetical protein
VERSVAVDKLRYESLSTLMSAGLHMMPRLRLRLHCLPRLTPLYMYREAHRRFTGHSQLARLTFKKET